MISRAFDSLFLTLAGVIPLAFLRVLAYHESSLDPGKVTKSSNATGLFQVVPKVLADYNLEHGTKWTLSDTKNPTLNAQIGIGLLTRIVKGYQKNHKSLATDWRDPRFVALVVQGFNAGYSETGGVGFVVGKMESSGLPKEKIAVDTVAQAAKKLGASRFLSMPDRMAYAKKVASDYFKEINAVPQAPEVVEYPLNGSHLASKESRPEEPVAIKSTMGNMIVLIVLPLTGLLALFASKKSSHKSALRSF